MDTDKKIQPKWKVLEYSKSHVKTAGKRIRQEDLSDADKQQAIAVIDNWRAAHGYPLHVIYMNLRRMAENKPEIIVAERLKRLNSIIGKLTREPSMSLTKMQDLGGCRFIVNSIDDVYHYSKLLENSRIRHVLKSEFDYIQNPKPSGYRSLHKVYEFRSDKKEEYNNGMLIEIQYRTHLQHVWATAVETMGLFTQQALKSGQGDDDIKRFFALASSLIAKIEHQPTVPDTSDDERKIIDEIRFLNNKHDYLKILNGMSIIMHLEGTAEYSAKHPMYYLLIFDYTQHGPELFIKGYKASEFEKANQDYSRLENQKSAINRDLVLVRANSFSTMRSAYPNYFSDIAEFSSIINDHLQSLIK